MMPNTLSLHHLYELLDQSRLAGFAHIFFTVAYPWLGDEFSNRIRSHKVQRWLYVIQLIDLVSSRTEADKDPCFPTL